MEEFGIQQCDSSVENPTNDDWQWVTQNGYPFICLSVVAANAERDARWYYSDGLKFRIVMRKVSKWEEF